jgi:hypothetical protein
MANQPNEPLTSKVDHAINTNIRVNKQLNSWKKMWESKQEGETVSGRG